MKWFNKPEERCPMQCKQGSHRTQKQLTLPSHLWMANGLVWSIEIRVDRITLSHVSVLTGSWILHFHKISHVTPSSGLCWRLLYCNRFDRDIMPRWARTEHHSTNNVAVRVMFLDILFTTLKISTVGRTVQTLYTYIVPSKFHLNHHNIYSSIFLHFAKFIIPHSSCLCYFPNNGAFMTIIR